MKQPWSQSVPCIQVIPEPAHKTDAPMAALFAAACLMRDSAPSQMISMPLPPKLKYTAFAEGSCSGVSNPSIFPLRNCPKFSQPWIKVATPKHHNNTLLSP